MPCNFTLQHYLDTVDEYKLAGYKLIQVKDLPITEFSDDDKYLLIRHDIDLSLDAAVELAHHEFVHGINSSYYVLLYSPLYNALSHECINLIKEIVKMKHEIGLHYDTRYEHSIHSDMKFLERLAWTPVTSYVQHFINDTPPITPEMYSDRARDEDVNALTEAYANGFKYISESGKHWREGCFCQHIDQHDKLMVLIHPEWWLYNGDQNDIIDKSASIEIERVQLESKKWKDQLVNYLSQFDRPAIVASSNS